MKYDVIVIGGGLSGLENAYILSKAGMKVLVLERSTTVGGCIQTYRRGSLTHDTGFHYVGGLEEGQSLYQTFRYMGLLDLPWKKLDKDFDRIRIKDKDFSFCHGEGEFLYRLCNEYPNDKEALKEIFRLMKITESTQFSFFDPHFDMSEFPFYLTDTGAWEYLKEKLHSDELIDLLGATSMKMELRKESLPLFSFLHGNSSFLESSWRLQGDASLLTGHLEKGITDMGGEIICRTEVKKLVEHDGRITHVECSDGQIYEASQFISSCHPVITCGMLEKSKAVRKTYISRIVNLENTYGFFTASVCVKSGSMKYSNFNQYIYTDGKVWDFHEENDKVDRIFISSRVPEHGEYVRQIDILTPVGSKKMEKWENTKVGKRGADYERLKNELAMECISIAEKIIGPICADSIYTSTPLTYRDYTGTPDGSAYGLRKDYRNLPMTVLSARTPLQNLYLTGQSLMLHGIHGVTVTSMVTCAELLGKDWIWNNILNK